MSSDKDLILPPVSEDNICLPLSINAVSQYWDVNLPMASAVEIVGKHCILIEGISQNVSLGCIVLHSGRMSYERS